MADGRGPDHRLWGGRQGLPVGMQSGCRGDGPRVRRRARGAELPGHRRLARRDGAIHGCGYGGAGPFAPSQPCADQSSSSPPSAAGTRSSLRRSHSWPLRLACPRSPHRRAPRRRHRRRRLGRSHRPAHVRRLLRDQRPGERPRPAPECRVGFLGAGTSIACVPDDAAPVRLSHPGVARCLNRLDAG